MIHLFQDNSGCGQSFPWHRAPVWAAVLLAALSAALSGQQADDIDVSLDALQRARDRVEKNVELPEGQRTALLQRYDEALSAVENAAAFSADAARFESDQAEALKLIQAFQSQSGTIRDAAGVEAAQFATTEQIEQALVEAEAELEVRRNEVRNLEATAQRRRQRLSEIAKRSGVLNQRIVDIQDSLEATDQTIADPLLRTATRARYLAQKRLAEEEVSALKAERASYASRAQLLPLRRDRAQRRVVEISREIAALENLAQRRSAEEAEAYLAEIDRQTEIADEKSRELSELTSEIREFAEMIFGPEGVSVKTDKVTRQLGFRREQTARFKHLMRLARRKFDVVGMRGDSSQWLPDFSESFPTRPELRAETRADVVIIPDVEHQLIMLEEIRAGDADLEAQLAEQLARLDISPDATDAAEWEALLRGLLTTRRELLDQLIVRHTRYLSQLRELAAASRESLAEIESGAAYLYERILWVRSVPGSMLPSLSAAFEGLRWLFADESWPESLSRSYAAVQEGPAVVVLGFVLLAGLLLLRPLLRKRLRRCGEQAALKDNLAFWPTVESLLITLALAIPLPYVLALLGRFLAAAQAAPVAFAVGQSLEIVAILAFALEFVVHSLRPGGLAEAHFHWSESAGREVGRELRRFMALFLPASAICLAFGRKYPAFIGMSPEVVFANSIGRIAFIATMLGVSFWIYRILRSGGEFAKLSAGDIDTKKRRRLRSLWPPLLSTTALGLALLAATGFYFTAFKFAEALLLSALLVLVLFVVGSFISRWTLIRSRHVRLAEQRRLEQEQEAHPDASEIQVIHEELVGADEVHQRISEFVRVSLTLIALFGLLAIWSEFLPTLRILERVEIWPELQLLSEEQAALMKAGRPAESEAVVSDSSGAAAETQGAAAALSPILPGNPLEIGSDSEAGGSPSDAPGSGGFLSLAGLLLALLTAGLTIVVARTVPALLEVSLLQRLAMETGDRKAVGTIVQYLIFAFGFSLAASRLGLTWGSIQWLAAAFSFGIAFGLQEIFANFVSGLIILLERPMRVGDAVEIGNLAGIVTKVEMRATTITTWNQSELVVPNKEFITGQIVNWTRSHRHARVEVPVGVAYGSDVDLVRKTLLEVAARHPDVSRELEPLVLFTEFGDSSLNFELRVHIDYDYGRMRMGDELRTEIDRAFRKNEITIAFPQLDLHMPSSGGASERQAEV
ncbi:MAG: mechanosensitive ion channel [Planctomycetota bacterium]|nr:mechanosensitive ion channel [Planctomycetota bacterium]